MVFSGTTFLFYFLPTLIILYFCVAHRYKNSVLLFASLLFYSWGEGFYVLLMLVSILLNYIFGRLLANKRDLRILSLGVAINLSLLITFKYSQFIVDNLNTLLNQFNIAAFAVPPVHLPLGISFFTFQAISYLVDIYRKEIPCQRNLLNLGLYISLFPQLIAGPIVRYKSIIGDIDRRDVSPALFASGVERFVFGLGKKMLIANPLGLVVDSIFSVPFETLPTHIAWFGILLYALQIYFDFSGYSDMAIGLGRMFGFRFLENFNYPYISNSVQEFWRRWHISLSTWFRDYLYIPLGGNRVAPIRLYLNLFIVFVLCGFWHGASWNFIVWGAFHGAFLTLERIGLSKLLSSLWRPFQHAYLILVILISWVFFRAETLTGALDYLRVMFSMNFSPTPFEVVDLLNVRVVVALLVGLLIAMPIYKNISHNNYNDGFVAKQNVSIVSGLSKLVLMSSILFLSIMSLASSTHNPFIYFRF